MTGEQELATRFTHHPPKGDQSQRYQAIRDRARNLAVFIDENAPDSREKDEALTRLEEAVFWVNAAIARRE